MRLLLVAPLIAASLDAAAVRGVVVENQTGRPVARALVVAQPAGGGDSQARSARSDSNGAFELGPLPGGAWIVSAARRGFAPAQYGQRRWQSAGVPIVLEENASTSIQIRLQRYGAISGTVLDENDVGLQDHEVVAYRNTRPPVIAARAATDDRGVYRIFGLEPGSYAVRTIGKRYDDGDYLPTFSRQTARMDDAAPIDVRLDQEATEADIRPFPGRLVTLSGRAAGYIVRTLVTLTLFSDTGSESTVSDAQGNFQFKPLPPGPYELYAHAGDLAAWQPVLLDRDTDRRITLAPLPELHVVFEDSAGNPVDPGAVAIVARREDLAGGGKPEPLRLVQGVARLAPGRWELTLAPSTSWYATPPRQEVTLSGPGGEQAKFVLSPHPAAIHGAAHAPGAPVFLQAYDPATQRGAAEIRATRADERGDYRFFGLAPGHYRLFASFDFRLPEPADMDGANPKVVDAGAGKDIAVDLDLYTVR